MSKPTKRAYKKRAYKKKEEIVKAPRGLNLFELEKGIPVPLGSREPHPNYVKIKDLIAKMKVGESFAAPRAGKHWHLKIIKELDIEIKIRRAPIEGNPNFERYHRIA